MAKKMKPNKFTKKDPARFSVATCLSVTPPLLDGWMRLRVGLLPIGYLRANSPGRGTQWVAESTMGLPVSDQTYVSLPLRIRKNETPENFAARVAHQIFAMFPAKGIF